MKEGGKKKKETYRVDGFEGERRVTVENTNKP